MSGNLLFWHVSDTFSSQVTKDWKQPFFFPIQPSPVWPSNVRFKSAVSETKVIISATYLNVHSSRVSLSIIGTVTERLRLAGTSGGRLVQPPAEAETHGEGCPGPCPDNSAPWDFYGSLKHPLSQSMYQMLPKLAHFLIIDPCPVVGGRKHMQWLFQCPQRLQALSLQTAEQVPCLPRF